MSPPSPPRGASLFAVVMAIACTSGERHEPEAPQVICVYDGGAYRLGEVMPSRVLVDCHGHEYICMCTKPNSAPKAPIVIGERRCEALGASAGTCPSSSPRDDASGPDATDPDAGTRGPPDAHDTPDGDPLDAGPDSQDAAGGDP